VDESSFLYVDRNDGDGEIFILLVLALPDQLRIEGLIAWVRYYFGSVFFVGHEVAQLAALDEPAADAGIAQKTVETVASEIKALHDNANGLELKARSTRLRDLTATLELHRSDAKHLQAAVDDQKSRVVEVGGVVRQAVQGIWSVAHLQRRSNAVEMTRAAFDLTRCLVTVETIAVCHRTYLESQNLEWFFATYSRSIDDRVAALRELPGRFATVRKIAENTADLDLSSFFPSRQQPNLN
jgi:hypothetical protein